MKHSATALIQVNQDAAKKMVDVCKQLMIKPFRKDSSKTHHRSYTLTTDKVMSKCACHKHFSGFDTNADVNIELQNLPSEVDSQTELMTGTVLKVSYSNTGPMFIPFNSDLHINSNDPINIDSEDNNDLIY